MCALTTGVDYCFAKVPLCEILSSPESHEVRGISPSRRGCDPSLRLCYSQWLRRKVKYKLPHTVAMSSNTAGYPHCHANSGMFSKFIP